MARATAAGLSPTDYEAFWSQGPDSALNASATWPTPPTNLMVDTEDMTGAAWTATGVNVTSTTVEDPDGSYRKLTQTVSLPDATAHNWTLWVLKDAVAPATRFPEFRTIVSANYKARLDTQSGATTEAAGLGGSIAVVSDGLYWRAAMPFTTDDALGAELVIYPAIGANADLATNSSAATGTITIAKQQLNVGASVLTYETVGADRQSIWDWSGNTNHLQRGSTSSSDTNDAQLTEDGTALRWLYTADDYDTVALSDASTVSYLAVIEVNSCAANRAILSKGGYDQWYLDTSCKPVFASTAGSDTATNALDVDKTYVVGVTVTGTSVSHFLSGAANGTGSVTTRTTGADSALLVGKLSGGSYFEGYIDLAAMDNSAINHSTAYTDINTNYEADRGLTIE